MNFIYSHLFRQLAFSIMILPIVCIIFTSLSACNDDGNLPIHTPEIVIEGWIDNDDFPTVILTETVSLSQGNQYFENKIIRWAKVTVSDGENTVVLTGGYNPRYYPPYVYTTTALRGKAGKRYTIEVKYKDYLATAETTIPVNTVVIDSIISSPCADSDTLYQIKAYINDNQRERYYYKMFSQVINKEKCFFASIPGTIDNAVTGNKQIEVPVYKGIHDTYHGKFSPFFTIGDNVLVKIAQMDSISYNFWIDYEDAVSFSGNMFFPVQRNLRSNISGGKGFWCGYHSEIKRIISPSK